MDTSLAAGSGDATVAIEYKVNASIAVGQFIDLLERSTLAERRPVADVECLAGALANSNLVVTAWACLADAETLVGIARSVTDFHYACYLSDLAVDQSLQRLGIGRELIGRTQQQLQPRCNLILLAAPAANDYYPRLGFSNNPRCWILPRERQL